MQSLKNRLGLGSKEDEGQEPVSGQQGAGTAAEPFDQGNQESDPSLAGKAPQATDLTSDASTGPSAAETTSPSSAQPDVAVPEPSKDVSSTETPAAYTTANSDTPVEPTSTTDDVFAPEISAPATVTDSAPTEKSTAAPSEQQPTSSDGIGSSSWLKTAQPDAEGKSGAEDDIAPAAQEATTTSTDAAESTESAPVPDKSLPPNQLSSDVPEGESTDFAPAELTPDTGAAAAVVPEPSTETTTGAGDAAPTSTDSDSALPSSTPEATPAVAATEKSAPTATESTPTTTEESVPATTEESAPITSESAPTTTEESAPAATEEVAPRAPDQPAAAELPGTKAPIYESRFNEDDPDVHKGNNPSAVPIAGGKPLGEAAVEERKDAGLPADPGPNLPQSVVGNPSPSEARAANGAASATPSSSDATKENVELSKSPEGKHKHNFLQKIKEKIKH